jgi:hypothetical protein
MAEPSPLLSRTSGKLKVLGLADGFAVDVQPKHADPPHG